MGVGYVYQAHAMTTYEHHVACSAPRAQPIGGTGCSCKTIMASLRANYADKMASLVPTKEELELLRLRELETAALDWIERRNALSAACQTLGIASNDLESWTRELLRREEPFRKFMEKYVARKRFTNLTKGVDHQDKVEVSNETSDSKTSPAPDEG
jgi:hypothetical protein